MTEREKAARGLWYNANTDTELLQLREDAEELCFRLNQTAPKDKAAREALLRQLLPHRGQNTTILSPFLADYGHNCFIGENVFLNHGAYLMDGAPITIGAYCFIGPNCGMYTANHPLLAEERETGLEQALPITIGEHCWIGGDVTILPGVTIGSHTVIGAKSVVTTDLPDHVLAVGNPCRVLRSISEEDSIF